MQLFSNEGLMKMTKMFRCFNKMVSIITILAVAGIYICNIFEKRDTELSWVKPFQNKKGKFMSTAG